MIQTQTEYTGTVRAVTDMAYGPLGQVITATVPYTATASNDSYITPTWEQPKTTYEYDALGRTTRITHTDQTTYTSTFYNGLLTATIDENRHQTITETDALGRLVSSKQYTITLPTDYDDAEWEADVYAQSWYEYDALDNLKLARAPRETSQPITMTYDALGRKRTMTDPDMGQWEYEYDAVGNLTRQTDAEKQVTCFYYDGLNRLIGKKYVTEVTPCPTDLDPWVDDWWTEIDAWYRYDWDFNLGLGDNHEVGRRTRMKNEHNRTSWVYDERGRVIAEMNEFDSSEPGVWDTAYTTSYTYDPADRVKTMTYPDGEVVEQGYNEQGLLTRVNGNKPYVDSSSYDAAGRLTERKLKNNSQSWTTTYNYYDWNDPELGRLHTSDIIGTQKEGESVVHDHIWQNLTYDYDAVGNIRTITDAIASQTQAFDYDALDRLIDASADGTDGAYTANYQFYKGGGIQQKELSTNSPTIWDYGYTDTDHIHAVTHINDVERYRYDANGNMNWRNVDGVEYDLIYNPENRLESVTDQSNGEVTRYTYDGDGNRVIMEVERDGKVEVTHYVGKIYERFFPATEIESAGGQNLGQMALSFVENIGQTDNPAVEYQSHAFGSNFFFTRNKVVLVLPDPDDPENAPAMVIAATFEGASPLRHIESLDETTGSVNYFRGDDPAGWHTGASTYAGIAYQDLYPGIWLAYNGSWRAVKAAYHVAPGASPVLIRWRYSGVTDVQIDPATGDLLVTPMTWDGDGQAMV